MISGKQGEHVLTERRDDDALNVSFFLFNSCLQTRFINRARHRLTALVALTASVMFSLGFAHKT